MPCLKFSVENKTLFYQAVLFEFFHEFDHNKIWISDATVFKNEIKLKTNLRNISENSINNI